MSNASSPSGNKSPEIFLPDYIEDLRQKNKLTAGDFAGEKLEELAAEFVKTLSDDSKVKLNIDKVTRKVGVSLVDDDNHVRYASACETVLKDKGEVVTLVVNKPLDGKYS
ncbi:hypothetical protein FS842_009403 [Serendipita sp. 407]|nr:hypothetical protein FS842_009403 [Serendipita sp. 407]